LILGAAEAGPDKPCRLGCVLVLLVGHASPLSINSIVSGTYKHLNLRDFFSEYAKFTVTSTCKKCRLRAIDAERLSCLVSNRREFGSIAMAIQLQFRILAKELLLVAPTMDGNCLEFAQSLTSAVRGRRPSVDVDADTTVGLNSAAFSQERRYRILPNACGSVCFSDG
jgi:hypothetical protein